MNLRILELFSGIGGMHYAFKRAELSGSVVAAVDINTVANDVYKFNFPEANILNKNIQKLSVKLIEKLNANVLLMSPPCQPHTRQGLRRDIEDKRSDALQHICIILSELTNIQYVLMENVKCFEESQAHCAFIKSLKKAGFYYREFILSPTQFGIPNTRHRYYCVARKTKDFEFSSDVIHETLPRKSNKDYTDLSLSEFLEPTDGLPANINVPEEVLLKRLWLMDIVNISSKKTMCFTKAYTHYHEGTGSIYAETSLENLKATFEKLKLFEKRDKSLDITTESERLNLAKQLNLRYFTPREVARLMCFPETFQFPTSTTMRQQYRLLGNSINVLVVAELIKLLCDS